MTIVFLDKTKADEILPEMYGILYDNMESIVPTGTSPKDGFLSWFSCVRPALEKEERKILLLYDGTFLAGFFQYYVNNGTFMMEEIQFREAYQGSGLFEQLYRFLLSIIPQDTKKVEAYADKNNKRSMEILSHLGLSIIGENKSGNCWHYQGEFSRLSKRYKT